MGKVNFLFSPKVTVGFPINLSRVNSYEKYGDRQIRFWFGPDDYSVWEFANKDDMNSVHDHLMREYTSHI